MFPAATAQLVTHTTLLDFQAHVTNMYIDRGYIIDWYANCLRTATQLRLPDIDYFHEFHDPDPDYVVPDSEAHGVVPPFGEAQFAHLEPTVAGQFRALATEVILTAHEPGEAQHTIVVFAQTSGLSFKKDAAEVYASFLRHFKIQSALFGVAAVKAPLTTGAKNELSKDEDAFDFELFNLEDSALQVVHHDLVPPSIKKVPAASRTKCLELLQCRRPLALHRKKNPFTPQVLPGQDSKDKVSRYFRLKEGDIVMYERVGSSSGWDRHYRHIRDHQMASSATSGETLTPSAGSLEGGAGGSSTGGATHDMPTEPGVASRRSSTAGVTSGGSVAGNRTKARTLAQLYQQREAEV